MVVVDVVAVVDSSLIYYTLERHCVLLSKAGRRPKEKRLRLIISIAM